MNDFILAWESLFGIYAPIEVIDSVTNEVTVLTDWGYVMRTAFFMMVVYCVLKLIGGVLRDGKR